MFQYPPRKETADSIDTVLAPLSCCIYSTHRKHMGLKTMYPRMPWFDHHMHHEIQKITWAISPMFSIYHQAPRRCEKIMASDSEKSTSKGAPFKLAGFALKWGCPKCPYSRVKNYDLGVLLWDKTQTSGKISPTQPK